VDDKFGLDPHNQAIGAADTFERSPEHPRPDKADDVDWVGIRRVQRKTRLGYGLAATALKAAAISETLAGLFRSASVGERAGRCGGPNRPLAFTSLGVMPVVTCEGTTLEFRVASRVHADQSGIEVAIAGIVRRASP